MDEIRQPRSSEPLRKVVWMALAAVVGFALVGGIAFRHEIAQLFWTDTVSTIDVGEIDF